MARGRPLLAAAWLCTLGVGAAAAWSPPPSPAQWVTDDAQLLSPSTREGLNAQLRQYEEQSGHQILVYLTTSLQGQVPEDFAVDSFKAWKVGRKGLDDGLVLFLFKDDHKIRIEVGYGLEDKIPDVIAARIIREQIAPDLQRGKADEAITAGVAALLQAIGDGSGGSPATGTTEPMSPRPPPRNSPLQNVLLAIVVLIVLAFAITHPGIAFELLWLLASSSGGGGGGGGGGGFSGGGGRSGGGGATGSW